MSTEDPFERLRRANPTLGAAHDAGSLHHSKERVMNKRAVSWREAGVSLAVVCAVAAASFVGISFVQPGEKPVLVLRGGAVNAEAATSGKMSADAALFYGNTEYVLADGVDIPSGNERVWEVRPRGDSALREVAERLGVTGLSRGESTPGAFDTVWQGDGFYASESGQWNFYSGESSVMVCSSPGVPDGTAVMSPTVEPCPVAPPAKNLPEDAKAIQTASRVVPGVDFGVEWRDDWSVTLSGKLKVDDGLFVQGWAYVTLGADGVVTSASSTEATVREVGEYETVSAAAAVGRIAAFGGARGTGFESVTAGPAVCGSTEKVPETQVVELVKVQRSVMLQWGAAGEVWVVPSYVFEDTNGGKYEVMALAEGAYQIEGTEGKGTEGINTEGQEPVPAVSAVEETAVTPSTAVSAGGAGGAPVATLPGCAAPSDASDIAARALGMSEEEATTSITGAGFEVRVVQRDDETFMVTKDYSANRVNVSIKDGVVVSAEVG